MSNPFKGIQRKKPYGKKSVDKESSFPALVKVADDVFSKRIRKRATNAKGKAVCFVSGDERRPAEMHCSHFIKRGAMALRYNEINCQCMTPEANAAHNEDTKPYRDRLIEVYGLKAVEELESLAHSEMKLSRIELLEIIAKYS